MQDLTDFPETKPEEGEVFLTDLQVEGISYDPGTEVLTVDIGATAVRKVDFITITLTL